MSLSELKAISPVFEEDIYDAISMETCVNTQTDNRCARRGCDEDRRSQTKRHFWQMTGRIP